MTRKFNVHYTCQHCGKLTTAETGFGRWMRNHSALDSVHGIVRTDTDHWIVRYKTSLEGRDFQLLMLVEAKEHGAEPSADQLDILHFVHLGLVRKGKNMHGSKTGDTFLCRSRVTGRKVRVRYFGYHLLQFENTNPYDSAWVKWDRKLISAGDLVGVLAMERNPDNPSRMMIEFLRDRHAKDRQQPLL
jgi:hypothetical protein